MVVIPFFVFLCLFFIYQRRNNLNFGVISYLIFIYLLSSFCSIIIFYFYGFVSRYQLEFEPVLFFSFSIGLVFLGFFRFRDDDFQYIVLSNFKLLKFIERVVVPLAFCAAIFFGGHAITVLTGNIEENRYLMIAGGDTFFNDYKYINSIFSLVANLFLLNMLFAFLNLSKGYPNGSRLKAIICLASSTVYIFYVLSYAGRDGFVYWVMSFLFFFLLFRKFIDEKNKKTLIKCALMLAAPAFLIFLMISLSRFGGNGTSGLFFSLLDYSGQQIFHFNEHYSIDAPLTYGEINFSPLVFLKSWFFGDAYQVFNQQEWFQYFLDRDVIPWVFVTFVGSFLHDFGKLGTLISVFFIFFITRAILLSLQKTKYFLLSNLIFFILIFQVISWGVFYYRQYSAFFYLLAMILLILILKFSRGCEKIVIGIANAEESQLG